MTVKVEDFGTLGTSDDSAVFQLAFDYAAANNEAVRGPDSGEFQMGSPVQYLNLAPSGQIAPGLIFECGGSGKVLFHNNHGGSLFTSDTGVDFKFNRSSIMSGFAVTGQGSGLTLRRDWQVDLHDLRFEDIPVGLNLPTLTGDGDACNKVMLDKVDFFNCSTWGLKCEVAAGRNELSYLSLRNVGFHNCGTVAGALGGGIYWRGQQLRAEMVSFTECKNRGLYVEGGSGLGGQVTFVNSSWENGTGKQVEIWGGSNFLFDACDFYSTALKSNYHMWVNAAAPWANNVHVRAPKVRCNPAYNPHTAFHAQGLPTGPNFRVTDAWWDQYGAAGQTKLVGFV